MPAQAVVLDIQKQSWTDWHFIKLKKKSFALLWNLLWVILLRFTYCRFVFMAVWKQCDSEKTRTQFSAQREETACSNEHLRILPGHQFPVHGQLAEACIVLCKECCWQGLFCPLSVGSGCHVSPQKTRRTDTATKEKTHTEMSAIMVKNVFITWQIRILGSYGEIKSK